MDVTVVSCVYGRDHRPFIRPWKLAVAALETQPAHVIIGGDHDRLSPWRHPQAFYLRLAISRCDTDYAWIIDIDDLALPDGLNNIHTDAAALIVGYRRPDGTEHIPPALSPSEYLRSQGNPYPAGSLLHVETFRELGGFRDVAFQDWHYWRLLAQNDLAVEVSDRAHYIYARHQLSRSARELLPSARADHLEEMYAA